MGYGELAAVGGYGELAAVGGVRWGEGAVVTASSCRQQLRRLSVFFADEKLCSVF